MSAGSGSGESLVAQLLRWVDSGARAHAPYSHHPVFAALRLVGITGELLPPVFGCNIENASYVGCCAERTALANAMTVAGADARLLEVAVLTPAPSGAPCGTCRQAIHERSSDVTVAFRWDGSWVRCPGGCGTAGLRQQAGGTMGR